MKVVAKLNYLHISPRKVRAVAGVVKGLRAAEALAQLKFVPNRAAGPLFKLMKSAIADAENNFSLEPSSLRIAELKVDGGPVFKRFRPGSKGRAAPLKKRTSHVKLVLEGERTASPQARKAAEKIESEVAPDKAAVKPREEEYRRDTFQARRVPAKKTGFVKRMFQRKSI